MAFITLTPAAAQLDPNRWTIKTQEAFTQAMGTCLLLAGALAAEAVLRLMQVEAWTGLDLARTDIQVGLIELAAAAVLPVLLLSDGERLRGYLATAVAAVAATLLTAGAPLPEPNRSLHSPPARATAGGRISLSE